MERLRSGPAEYLDKTRLTFRLAAQARTNGVVLAGVVSSIGLSISNSWIVRMFWRKSSFPRLASSAMVYIDSHRRSKG
jgi:hypothetical protein